MSNQREEELKALDWRELRSLAQSYGITKTEGQNWEDVIPDLLLYERARPSQFSVEPDEIDNTAEPPDPLAAPPPKSNKSVYPTEYFKKIGAMVCEECGSPKRTQGDNQPFCPSSKPNCPFLK